MNICEIKHIFQPRLITHNPFENTKIISHALIVLALSTKRVICVQRLHSVEFLLLLMGQYRPSLIVLFLPNMTQLEHFCLMQLVDHDKEYFTHVYMNEVGLDERDLDYGYLRFEEVKPQIKEFLTKINTHSSLKWTWPKGRMSAEDKDDSFLCAKREFIEEVEIELPPPLYVSPHYLNVEIIKTLACKTIETRGWLYIIEDEVPLPPLMDHKEVSDRQWIDYREAVILLKQESLLPIIDAIVNTQ